MHSVAAEDREATARLRKAEAAGRSAARPSSPIRRPAAVVAWRR
jgi:hypothetical protein